MAQVCSTLSVQATNPNVVVEAVEMYISGTSSKVTTITQGQAVDIVVWISNSGGPASNVLVEAKVGTTVVGSQTVASVPTIPSSNPTYIEFTNRQIGSAGSYQLCGAVSGAGVTANSKCISVTVQQPAAQVVVERVEAYLAGTNTKVTSITQGQAVDVVVWVSNVGGPATNIRIDAYVGSTTLGSITTSVPTCQPTSPAHVDFTNRQLGSAGNINLCGAAYTGTTLISNKCIGITINPVPSNVVIKAVEFFKSGTTTKVTSVAAGEKFDVYVWLTNTGSATGQATINLYSNNTLYATMTTSSISHTEENYPVYVQFNNRSIDSAGTYNMCAGVTGSGISTAQLCSSLTVTPPTQEYNLVISSGPTITPNTCEPNQKVTISFTIKNNGPSDYPGGGYVKVTANNTVILNYGPMPAITVNSYRTSSFYYTPTAAGTYNICAEIFP